MYDVENDQDTTEKDPGSEIVAGLLPLLRYLITNVTWIVLNDIELGETDLDDIGMFSLASIFKMQLLTRSQCQH